MAGVDLTTVEALMGHKNVTMTRRYMHLSAHHKQQAVAMLREHRAEKVPAIFPTGRLSQAGTSL
jgi:integrase